MLRKKKNETRAQFTARLAQARKVAFPESHAAYATQHLAGDDPVKAVTAIIRGLVMSLEGDLNAESHRAHALVAAELVKLAIDHRASVKSAKDRIPAPTEEVPAAE